jgi:hypothetical protein
MAAFVPPRGKDPSVAAFFPSVLRIADWGQLKCQTYVAGLKRVECIWDLTFVFWAENGKK